MSVIRVGIAQAHPAPDLAGGLRQAAILAQDAAAAGVQLLAFPETWLPGYPAWLDHSRDAALWNHAPVKAEFARMAEHAVVVAGESGDALSRIAREHALTLVMGVVERVTAGPGRGTLYNALLTYTPDGELANHHRKLMPTYTERMVWGAGDAVGLRAVETPSGRVGGLVCWEHWMPLARQTLHDSGEDIHVAVWPFVHEMHQIASRHYAFEGRCFVLAAGSILRADALPRALALHEDRAGELVLRGGSFIAAPDGSIVAGPVFDREELLVADLDLTRVREESMTLDVSGHYARPDCFEFRPIRPPRPSE